MADANGLTPLHIAAANANLVAIQIIYDSIESSGQQLDPNTRSHLGATPLSYTGAILPALTQRSKDDPAYALEVRSFRRRMAETFAYLRNRGGRLPSELEGVVLR